MRIDYTSDLWWKNAVVYCLDVETYSDSDGGGVGDFRGLIDKVDYLAGLGVTCLWLMPFYPSPNRDGRYDISAHYAVHPRLRTRRPAARHARRLRRARPHLQRPRHADHRRPRRQPHLRRAPVVH